MSGITVESFRPLNGWVLVKVDPWSGKTESGVIHIPGESREHMYQRATVIKVSDGWAKKLSRGGLEIWRRIPCPLKIGMRVLIPFFYAHKTFKRFRESIESNLVVPIKPEDVVLYDDAELNGKGVDDYQIGRGGM